MKHYIMMRVYTLITRVCVCMCVCVSCVSCVRVYYCSIVVNLLYNRSVRRTAKAVAVAVYASTTACLGVLLDTNLASFWVD